MSAEQQNFLRQLLDAGLEYGDGGQASEDAIAVVFALASGQRERLQEVVEEIVERKEEESQ